MLPTHRVMKNGRGDFYNDNDDKYEKSKSTGLLKKFKHLNRKTILGVGFVFVLFLFYTYRQEQMVDPTSTVQDGQTPTKEQPPVIPFDIADEEEVKEVVIPDTLDEKEPFKDVLNESTYLFTQYPPPASLIPEDKVTAARQKRIVEAFQHSWKGYSTKAFGRDEYKPLSRTGENWASGGLGLMIIDSLDTMLLMNLTTEYDRARTWIDKRLYFDKKQNVNVFETTIRILGGLLSAYHLSNNDKLYLDKATDLGDRLMRSFTTESGIPYAGVNLWNGITEDNGPASTAEATTLQLEFKYLSHLTGDMKYWNAAEKVMERLNELVHGKDSGAIDGLVPIYMDPVSGNFVTNEIRLGSRGDSYYEYLLKQYLQTDKSEIKYRERYDHAMDGVKKHLIQKSYPGGLTYIAEMHDSRSPLGLSSKMDHLVCFMGGSFVLGVTEGASIHELDPLDAKDSEDFRLGQELTETCYNMYHKTATGLASEIVYFNDNPESTPDTADMAISPRDAHNLLRPETVESIFLLYRMTGEEKYREWGWEIFEAFEKYAKVDGGFAALIDVTTVPPEHSDRMDTFWLAETLKYLYLLFSPDDIIPLDSYVFNTEAHPLPIFTPNL